MILLFNFKFKKRIFLFDNYSIVNKFIKIDINSGKYFRNVFQNMNMWT